MEIKSIMKEMDLPRCRYCFELNNPSVAKKYEVELLCPVREIWKPLDLYAEEAILVLSGPISDINGVVNEKQEEIVDSVAELIRVMIENDVPGFLDKIKRIIAFYQREENLDERFAYVLNDQLKESTKIRFMNLNDLWLYAKIIRMAMEESIHNSDVNLDQFVNQVFDNRALINELNEEINS